MNIDIYFNYIKNYIKTKIDDPNNIDNLLLSLKNNNIQLLINQCYNDNNDIEECGDKILSLLNNDIDINNYNDNELNGIRSLNTMERKILNFNNFIKNIKQ